MRFEPARPADEVCGPARMRLLRRLGTGVILAFCAKGIVTTGLLAYALFKLSGN